MDAIREFRAPYGYLSNFFVEPDGTHVEGEYQAAKTLDPLIRQEFRYLDPKRAKALGRRIHLRADWEDIKLDVMAFYVWQKFTDHYNLKQALLRTGDAYLEEGNVWHDTYWGCCNCAQHQGQGQNMLGHILMQVRADIQARIDEATAKWGIGQ